ncbi:hypothetical protein PC129_g15653 [Phytophthora cactorum]|uniref:Uncharacterized protein n=1 Tax=Phytophthora cactorum TaxID=29920 RepID=A0A329SQM0_9STRA|nr:hypothetical protein Pcac1_g4093 [Phytophthora cactorum]KAG2807882.1 hypothetical protein PC112_g17213 [Phytophthora cactorum]KAG2809454.1 hypothetical protein PC111_g16047 [Phytophthora cactorum]KAG2849953.1 hypothetical protein PC113_g17227 [Phytophthora cactorum]KAG2887741.1 hypothetical protein PC114_g18700 [Phytophthora cactorum]
MEAKAKDEIQGLIDQYVLEQIYNSEMTSPSFSINVNI